MSMELHLRIPISLVLYPNRCPAGVKRSNICATGSYPGKATPDSSLNFTRQ